MAGELKDLLRSHVEQDRLRRRQLVDALHALAGDDFAAERFQESNQSIRNILRASFRQWPADVVPGDAEHQTDGSARRLLEGQHAVRGDAGKERPSPLSTKAALGETARGAERRETEP